jgi:hypothetical protein
MASSIMLGIGGTTQTQSPRPDAERITRSSRPQGLQVHCRERISDRQLSLFSPPSENHPEMPVVSLRFSPPRIRSDLSNTDCNLLFHNTLCILINVPLSAA